MLDRAVHDPGRLLAVLIGSEYRAFVEQPVRVGLLEEAAADLVAQDCEAMASTGAPLSLLASYRPMIRCRLPGPQVGAAP